MQGRSLKSICQGKPPSDWRTSIYYHYYQATGGHRVPKHYGIRTDQYKLIHYYEQGDWELYDLEADLSEINNIYPNKEYHSIQVGLKEKLKNLHQKYLVGND